LGKDFSVATDVTLNELFVDLDTFFEDKIFEYVVVVLYLLLGVSLTSISRLLDIPNCVTDIECGGDVVCVAIEHGYLILSYNPVILSVQSPS